MDQLEVMRHRDYVVQRAKDSPEFETFRAIAEAELALALALHQRREALGQSYDELAGPAAWVVARAPALPTTH